MKFLEKIFMTMFVIGVCVAFSVPAAAYIDASMLTYSIQIGTGIVIAIGAAAGVIIVRIKKKMKDKLNIDMDAKKESEEKIVRYDTKKTSDDESKPDGE